ncbi:MAG: hypothetical protein HYY59_04915 [Candidatus Omnitrophica bacterium]|nr:hypothetical protein [Candidatus Omnitrophota bacterium]
MSPSERWEVVGVVGGSLVTKQGWRVIGRAMIAQRGARHNEQLAPGGKTTLGFSQAHVISHRARIGTA